MDSDEVTLPNRARVVRQRAKETMERMPPVGPILRAAEVVDDLARVVIELADRVHALERHARGCEGGRHHGEQ